MTTPQDTLFAAARTGQIRMTLSAATLLLIIALIPFRAGAQTPVYDAATDFSITSNPDGVWSYGCTESLGAAFQLYTQSIPFTGVGTGVWAWAYNSTCAQGSPPALGYNLTNTPITEGSFTLPAHEVWFHPGPEDQNSVLRFTAPATGNYKIQAVFWGDDFVGPTTTDVHVLHNNLGLYTGEVTGFGPSSDQSFTTTISVAAGDTIDFAVGYGTDGGYGFDATGVSAVITQLALSCQLTGIVNGPPKQIKIAMQALPPGLNTIQLTSSTNATVAIPSFVVGTTSPVTVTATKVNQAESSDVAFTISNTSGATASCDPVDYTATIEKGPETHTFRKVSSAEHYIRIVNGQPGLSRVTFIVNGKRFPEVTFKKDGETRIVDIGSAMYDVSNDNAVVMEAVGRRGASAFLLIGDASVE